MARRRALRAPRGKVSATFLLKRGPGRRGPVRVSNREGLISHPLPFNIRLCRYVKLRPDADQLWALPRADVVYARLTTAPCRPIAIFHVLAPFIPLKAKPLPVQARVYAGLYRRHRLRRSLSTLSGPAVALRGHGGERRHPPIPTICFGSLQPLILVSCMHTRRPSGSASKTWCVR